MSWRFLQRAAMYAVMTTFKGTSVVRGSPTGMEIPHGEDLIEKVTGYVDTVEQLGISHLLIAQRWWGSGEEIEASSLDCKVCACGGEMHVIGEKISEQLDVAQELVVL